jgi:hypothetical protein
MAGVSANLRVSITTRSTITSLSTSCRHLAFYLSVAHPSLSRTATVISSEINSVVARLPTSSIHSTRETSLFPVSHQPSYKPVACTKHLFCTSSPLTAPDSTTPCRDPGAHARARSQRTTCLPPGRSRHACPPHLRQLAARTLSTVTGAIPVSHAPISVGADPPQSATAILPTAATSSVTSRRVQCVENTSYQLSLRQFIYLPRISSSSYPFLFRSIRFIATLKSRSSPGPPVLACSTSSTFTL